MIPLELQDLLIERFKNEFRDIKLKNIKNERVSISLFPQHLPTKSKNDADNYPCIIVRLANGSNNIDLGVTTIQFIIGVVDRENDNQGYRDALSLGNKIIESLTRNPVIENKYELNLPINWAYNDEDAEPYYFAGLETNWNTPTYLREDVEDLI